MMTPVTGTCTEHLLTQYSDGIMLAAFNNYVRRCRVDLSKKSNASEKMHTKNTARKLDVAYDAKVNVIIQFVKKLN